MYVVGGHGYVGSRVVDFAFRRGTEANVVSRDGDDRCGMPSLAWAEFIAQLGAGVGINSVVWLLDGAKHNELDRIGELLDVADERLYVAAVSTATVYGDQAGRPCDESTASRPVTKHAEVKASCEAALLAAPVQAGILRFGALYGPDNRKVRSDRVEKWVTEAATHGTVTVPEPSHWRGWLNKDQGARALFRAADGRIPGIFNVATSNYRFGDAAGFAAKLFDAKVQSDGKPDPMNYMMIAERARQAGLLDEGPGESLAETVDAFAKSTDRSGPDNPAEANG